LQRSRPSGGVGSHHARPASGLEGPEHLAPAGTGQLAPELDKTLAKLEAYRAHLTQGEGFGYVPQDAVAFLQEHDPDHAVFIAPPTFGSRDYINQERMLAASASWPAPEYGEISFKDVPIYEQITSFREWMIIMERPLPEVEKILGEPVAVVHKGRKSITYAYAGHSRRRIVTRGYLPSRSPGPIFPGDRVLTGTEKPGLVLLDKKQTVRMNELFMSVRVDYFLADVALSIGLCLDGRIIGKLDFTSGRCRSRATRSISDRIWPCPAWRRGWPSWC